MADYLGWQGQYAAPDWQSQLTKLSPEEEGKFQQWWQKTGGGRPLTPDYDMRGFWKSGQGTSVNPIDGLVHFSDQFKTPLHQSFSNESNFVAQNRRALAPYWSDQPNKFGQLISPMNGAPVFDEHAALIRALAERAKRGR